VYVCDTLGELQPLYSLAGVSFVGASLVPLGGHNLLEAARAGCPVLHGPHVGATRQAADALAGTHPPSARQVGSAAEMAAAANALLCDAALRKAKSEAAVAEAARLEAGMLRRVWAELEGPLGLPPLDPGVAGGGSGREGRRHGDGA
jgi:3-deoxy-D-manno-octulosonic-acid transferase